MSAPRSTRSSIRTSIVTPPLSSNFKGYSASPPAESAPEPKQANPTPTYDTPMHKEEEGDTVMADAAPGADANGDKPKWIRVKTPGDPARKRRNKALILRRVRRHITPKNAIVALKETCPSAEFAVSAMAAGSQVYTAQVTANGKKFHGVGGNKSLARAAAAELALQSLVKAPVKVTNADGTETTEDETPWPVLASFALHKLFCDWKRGVVGTPVSVESAASEMVVGGPGGGPSNFTPPPRSLRANDEAGEAGAAQNAKRRLEKPQPADAEMRSAPTAKKPRADKTLPTDALQRNPVQLLAEMRPDCQFKLEDNVGRPSTEQFSMVALLDEKVYQGIGRSKKLAKRDAAKKVMSDIYGLTYPPEEEPAAMQPAVAATGTSALTAVSYQ